MERIKVLIHLLKAYSFDRELEAEWEEKKILHNPCKEKKWWKKCGLENLLWIRGGRFSMLSCTSDYQNAPLIEGKKVNGSRENVQWPACGYVYMASVCRSCSIAERKRKNLEDLLLVLGLRLPRGCYRIVREPQCGQQPYLRSLCNSLLTCL